MLASGQENDRPLRQKWFGEIQNLPDRRKRTCRHNVDRTDVLVAQRLNTNVMNFYREVELPHDSTEECALAGVALYTVNVCA